MLQAPTAPAAPRVATATGALEVRGLGPFVATWDPYTLDASATFPLYLDGVRIGEAPAGATTFPFRLAALGPHRLELAALVAGVESIERAAVAFTATAIADPCAVPFGAHAPAIFVTNLAPTTGRPGSRSAISFQLAAPDPVIELAVRIDDVEQLPIVRAGPGDLRSVGSLWFTQPAAGTHTIAVRVLTAFGCTLTRAGAPLVVTP